MNLVMIFVSLLVYNIYNHVPNTISIPLQRKARKKPEQMYESSGMQNRLWNQENLLPKK